MGGVVAGVGTPIGRTLHRRLIRVIAGIAGTVANRDGMALVLIGACVVLGHEGPIRWRWRSPKCSA